MPLSRAGYHPLSVALCLGYCVAKLLAAAPANPELALRVQSETAPAGGWAQFKVFAATPHLVVGGTISMDFDPAVFGSIASVAVFSATGDALGYANVNGQHVDAHFSSPSAGIGQLPNLPLFAVWIPVLAGAKAGASTAVTLDPSGSPWTDAQGNTYTVTVNGGAVTVGGGLSVTSVTPGGGILPAGSALEIAGMGFDSTTTMAIDGVAVASLRFINSTQMEATLGGATELTGQHFHLANANGQMLDYFSAFPSSPTTPPPGFSGSIGIHPLVPLNVFSKVITYSHSPLTSLDASISRHGLAMLNQTQAPVTVFRTLFSGATTVDSFAIPPGTLYLLDDADRDVVIASAAIRMLEVFAVTSAGVSSANVYTPEVYAISLPIVQVPLSQTVVSWNWQTGTPQPDAASIDVGGNLGFTVEAPATPWLTVTPTQGTAPVKLTLKPNLALMAPGVYTAIISVNPTLPAAFPAYNLQTAKIAVNLTVSARPQILASTYSIVIFQPAGGVPVQSTPTVTLTSNGQPADYTALASTIAGTWLSVTPVSGTTPATLTVTANTDGLTGGMYSGEVDVFGPANTLRLVVSLTVLPLPSPPPTGNLSASPLDLSFDLPGGGPAQQSIYVWPVDASIQVSVPTPAGGGWLTAQMSSNTPGYVLVNASAANLTPGTYRGVVLISSTISGSVQIPVTLTVLNTEIAPTVTPSSLALTAPAGEAATAKLTVTSGVDPVRFVYAVSPQSQDWLSALGGFVTPDTIQATANYAQTGTYQGEVLVTWAKGVIHIPVTFTATPSSVTLPPQTTAILSAASQTPGPMTPGEIFTIFGLGIGPAPAGLQLDASGKVATSVNGVQVTVNDVAAPLVYASPGQLNAIVPYETGISGVARVRVTYGQASSAWEVPLSGAAPAIFTIGSTGVGQGAVLNQDSSVNGPANPAVRGSVIQIFATGEGQTSPTGGTGTVTGSSGGAPVLHVTVTVGGIEAPLEFAGAAPFAVAGLLQVNAVVPPGAPSGSAVPIMLSVGGVPSPSGVTIAVQ